MMKKAQFGVLAVGLTMAGTVLTGCGATEAQDAPAATSSKVDPPVMVEPMSRYLSSTLADWQAHADAIVVAHVSKERRHQRSEPEPYMDPEGWELVGRTVTLDIQQVAWSDLSKTGDLDDQVSFKAAGWFDNTHRSVEAVFGSGSRLEVGHDYVIALNWYSGRRDPENPDDVIPASWGVLGSDAILPVDDGVVGRGEYGGEVARGLAANQVPRDSLLAENLGKSLDEFLASLDGFTRVKRPS